MTTYPPPMPLTLHLDPVVRLDDGGLFDLCGLNRELRIERNAEGGLIVMSPAGGETSDRNAEVTMQLALWAKRDGTGRVFDSSGGFVLPSGAMRSPDAAWVERSRLRGLTPAKRRKFLPLCPAFVIEIRSPSDGLPVAQDKMQEYLDNGARLGWLIDPEARRVHVYRTGRDPEIVEDPTSISGGPELPGLVLELAEVWDPSW